MSTTLDSQLDGPFDADLDGSQVGGGLATAAPPETTQEGGAGESLHITWVNQHAALTGGAEHYIFNTVQRLNERGFRNTLLYDVDGEIDPRYTKAFAEAYPMVEVARQLQEIDPDLLFAHRIEGTERVNELTAAGPPALRFFHDHKLFCLREHKYTTIGHRTCTRPAGLGCYACLGFLAKSESWPGVTVNSLGRLQFEQRCNQKFDGYVVGSPYMARHIAEHGFDESRIHTIPLYAPQPKACGHERPRRKKQFLFAGALLRGKGLDVLLDAMTRMKSDSTLVVAGSGHQEEQYRDQVENAHLTYRVQFVGRLAPEEIADQLETTTCVVAPSRSPETFGLSGLEAFSHGAPVIASEVGGMGTWLKHDVNGLFFPSGDADALAAAMDRIVSEEGLAKRLGEAGRKDYLNSFTPENHIDRLTKMFHTVVAGRRSEG